MLDDPALFSFYTINPPLNPQLQVLTLQHSISLSTNLSHMRQIGVSN